MIQTSRVPASKYSRSLRRISAGVLLLLKISHAMSGASEGIGSFGNTLLIRNCRPTVYLNGMRMDDEAASDLDMLANPSELTAVEVYTAAGRPAEFWGNDCGSVVLWAGTTPH